MAVINDTDTIRVCSDDVLCTVLVVNLVQVKAVLLQASQCPYHIAAHPVPLGSLADTSLSIGISCKNPVLFYSFIQLIYFIIIIISVALRPNAGHGLLIHEVSRSHTTTHHRR